MTTIVDFADRIDSEFAASWLGPIATHKRQSFCDREYHDFQQQFERLFVPALAQLHAVWAPRRDALLVRFKDYVHLQLLSRDEFDSVALSVASTFRLVNLRFTFSHDPELRSLNLECGLNIVPMLMNCDKHSTLVIELDSFDTDAAAQWLENLMITFLQTFLRVNQGQYDLKDQTVEDPVAHIQIPSSMATEAIERDGHMYYFICAATRREFDGASYSNATAMEKGNAEEAAHKWYD